MFDQEEQRFRLSPDYLTALASQALLKYVVISHFGRGRGRYTSPSAPAQWNDAVQAAVQAHASQWQALWAAIGAQEKDAPLPDATRSAHLQSLQLLLGECLQQALQTLYPGVATPLPVSPTANK